MDSQRIFTGAPWEKSVAYCRAIQRGPFIAVAGTTSMIDGAVFAPGDPYLQAKRCLEIILESLEKLGASRRDVVRTRMFVTDISHWSEFARAHAECFSEDPPATSMYQIQKLISPELLIEIEAEAIVSPS